MSRPTKLTPEVQAKIVQAIRVGNYAEVAARYAGIGERTFYTWMETGSRTKSGLYKQFRQAVKDAEAESEVSAVAQIRKQMPQNWAGAMTFLERRFQARWRRHEATEVTGAGGGPVTVTFGGRYRPPTPEKADG